MYDMHAVSGHLNLYFGNFRIRDKAEIEYILCDKGSNHSVHRESMVCASKVGLYDQS